MNVEKMRMFRWLSGNIVMTEYKIEIYSKLEVASVVSKMRESCIRSRCINEIVMTSDR